LTPEHVSSVPLESQFTSLEAGPGGEPGEESTTETSFPFGDDMQELPSGFESRQTLSDNRLAWIDTAVDPMTNRIWISL
jgi:hypothetical protein